MPPDNNIPDDQHTPLEPTFDEIQSLYNNFKNYVSTRINFYSKFEKKQRNPNFPEDISENIVKMLISKYEKRKCIWDTSWGDLLCLDDDKTIEVKCFSSLAPTSFGPSEEWHELYFLDATSYHSNHFKCYKINIPHNSDIWEDVPVNKSQSLHDFRLEGKRPRITFKKLYLYLSENYPNYIEIIFDGILFQ